MVYAYLSRGAEDDWLKSAHEGVAHMIVATISQLLEGFQLDAETELACVCAQSLHLLDKRLGLRTFLSSIAGRRVGPMLCTLLLGVNFLPLRRRALLSGLLAQPESTGRGSL